MADDKKKLINPIENLFETTEQNNTISAELFIQSDITLRTELNNEEQVLMTCLIIDNALIKEELGFDLYGGFIKEYMRTKVSLDRKSRKEFVDSINKNNTDKDLERLSNLKNLTEVKK